MLDLKGIIPPMVTPFEETGAIRYDAFGRNIEEYVKAGIEGYLVLGSNGESVYLEHSEKLKLIEVARKQVPASMTLLAGTGLESTRATIELTKEAADRGVDAVLVKNPFYFKSQMTFDVTWRTTPRWPMLHRFQSSFITFLFLQACPCNRVWSSSFPNIPIFAV